MRTYLDWNATAPLRPQARAAMLAALDADGNPSSVHREGREARRLIEEAREHVAALVGAEARHVTFTSGGTEANSLALTPFVVSGKDMQARTGLVVSSTEHASVLEGGRFAKDRVFAVAVDRDGVIDLAALDNAMARAGARPLVSLHHANNETGVIQPVVAVAERVHAANGLLHVDAVQSAGKIATDITSLGADLLTLSAHKLGGPKGGGALVARSASLHIAAPLLTGGGQERGRRAGTENVAGIVAFGAAAQVAAASLAPESARTSSLRDAVEAKLRAIEPAAIILAAEAERLPNTTLFAVPGIRAETALVALDLDGVAVSSGSACSSGKVAPSHVLAAMGVAPDLSACAIRVSFGWTTTERDIDRFIQAWTKLSERLSKGRQGIAA